jgi:hypothetical protein
MAAGFFARNDLADTTSDMGLRYEPLRERHIDLAVGPALPDVVSAFHSPPVRPVTLRPAARGRDRAALASSRRGGPIHPFPNGNGRHARIMADTALVRVLSGRTIRLGRHNLPRMNDRRLAYLAALKSADRRDIGPLIAFIGPRGDL